MGLLTDLIKSPIRFTVLPRSNGHTIRVSQRLVESARADTATVLQGLNTQLGGLAASEVEARLEQYGPNEVATEKRPSVLLKELPQGAATRTQRRLRVQVISPKKTRDHVAGRVVLPSGLLSSLNPAADRC